jgi:selenoprotein W-related protein
LLEEFEAKLSEIRLIVSTGGVFEVSVDDTLVYSKKATGEHPEYEEIRTALLSRTR